MSYARAAVVVAVLLSATRLANAQISVDEANRRLRERTASTRPAETQPVSELARVTEENRRLRVRVAQLEAENATLRQVMGQASPTTVPTTQRSGGNVPDNQRVPIAGTWRGGEPNRGSGFLLEFNTDGTYRRTFLSYSKRETGQYNFSSPVTIEMWADGIAEATDHNEYRVSIENGQLTLTPTHVNGRDVNSARPMVLSRAQ